MNPATLSIIVATFPARQRGTAIGIWAGVSALALAIGPLVGGMITERISWSWIFFINVPIGVLGIVAAYVFIDESRDTSQEQRPDVPGLVTSTVGLFALTYAPDRGEQLRLDVDADPDRLRRSPSSRSSPSCCSSTSSGCRCSSSTSSATRRFSGANTVMLLVGLAMFGVFFYVSLYVQQVLGYSPIEAGASFLPWTILIILLAPLAGQLSDRIGPRPLVVGGMIVLTGSLLLFARMGEHETFWDLLPAMLLGGVGMSAAMAPTTAAAMQSVRAGQGRRRLGRPEQHAPGRRLARDRDHGRDRRRVGDARACGIRPASSTGSTTRS